MKVFKTFILLAVCLVMASCGGDNLESYKSQYLDAMAKDMKTTKEFMMKDLDVVVDSMKIIPVTVSDSLFILEEFSKMSAEEIANTKKQIREYKRMEGLISLFAGADNEQYRMAKALIDEGISVLSSLETAIKVDLPRYKEMDKDFVLVKVFSAQIAMKNASGVHEISKEMALFSSDGKLVNFKCPYFLAEYLNQKK